MFESLPVYLQVILGFEAMFLLVGFVFGAFHGRHTFKELDFEELTVFEMLVFHFMILGFVAGWGTMKFLKHKPFEKKVVRNGR